MSASNRALQAGGACCLALFAFAFVAGPHSCEWGLTAYFWSGIVCLVVVLLLPIFVPRDQSAQRRVLTALALAALACVTWIAGLIAGNVRIMCRLF